MEECDEQCGDSECDGAAPEAGPAEGHGHHGGVERVADNGVDAGGDEIAIWARCGEGGAVLAEGCDATQAGPCGVEESGGAESQAQCLGPVARPEGGGDGYRGEEERLGDHPSDVVAVHGKERIGVGMFQ